MKGMIELEFIISVLVFVTSISFVTAIIISNIPLLHNTATGESLKSLSYQYSEMFLFDEGYSSGTTPITSWQNGNFASVSRLGFSTGDRYFVDLSKIQKFSDYCADPLVGYSAIKALLGVDTQHDIGISASKLNGSALVGTSAQLCGPEVTTKLRQQFHIIRYGLLPTGEIVQLKITVIS